jgi:hypothetical protein
LLDWLKRLFGGSSEEPPAEGLFEENELPAGPLTGLTSPLYAGGDRATAELFGDEHS